MDKATQTMIENLHKNTGQTLEYWIDLVKQQNFLKHSEIVKYLKINHQFTHGFANLVAHKTNESDSGSAINQNDLIENQYKGKENLKPFYDSLISTIKLFGSDIEISPKNTYVSLRTKKQFATLNPATKTRFEIGINLKGQEAKGKLMIEKPNSMCSHKINLSSIEDIDEEVLEWLKLAYHKSK